MYIFRIQICRYLKGTTAVFWHYYYYFLKISILLQDWGTNFWQLMHLHDFFVHTFDVKSFPIVVSDPVQRRWKNISYNRFCIHLKKKKCSLYSKMLPWHTKLLLLYIDASIRTVIKCADSHVYRWNRITSMKCGILNSNTLYFSN